MRYRIYVLTVFTVLSAFALSLSSAPPAIGQSLETVHKEKSLYASFVGLGGRVFDAGRGVEISWILKGKEVSNLEDNPWSECELFFSPDGGVTWTRITPKLSVSRRSHAWTIPNVSTERASIALQIGIEGEGEFHFFQSESFAIRPSPRGQ